MPLCQEEGVLFLRAPVLAGFQSPLPLWPGVLMQWAGCIPQCGSVALVGICHLRILGTALWWSQGVSSCDDHPWVRTLWRTHVSCVGSSQQLVPRGSLSSWSGRFPVRSLPPKWKRQLKDFRICLPKRFILHCFSCFIIVLKGTRADIDSHLDVSGGGWHLLTS